MPREPTSPVADAIPPRLRRKGGTPRQVLALTLIGTLALGLFASRDLPSWTERFEIPALSRLAATWDGAMAALGLTRPHETLRAAVARLIEVGWGGKD